MSCSHLCSVVLPIRQTIGQLGWIDGGLYLSSRLITRITPHLSCNKYYFVAQSLASEPLLPSGRGTRFVVREWPKEQALVDHPCPRPVTVLSDRYQQGAVCLTAFKTEKFAGCLWYAKDRFCEDEVRAVYELPVNKAVWDFDVYVEPQFRLSPVFLKLWDATSERLCEEGIYWSLSRISAFNAVSLASHYRMGAQYLGWAVFLRMGFLQVTFSSLRPFFHISISSKSMPIFRFSLP